MLEQASIEWAAAGAKSPLADGQSRPHRGSHQGLIELLAPSNGQNREIASPDRTTGREKEPSPSVEIRNPTAYDGAAIWKLVAQDPVLDTNSCYAYLLLCRHHAETCVVAMQEDRLAGFVTAYFPPAQPDTIFVWQIAVSDFMRKKGLGRRMLRHLLKTPAGAKAKYLEATVSPSNLASLRLFQSLAKELGVPFQADQGFHREHFRELDHEDEPLIRIGPLEDGCT